MTILNRQTEFIMIQLIVSFKRLCRGFVTKKWLQNTDENIKVDECNKIIVGMTIKFYYQYQINRNKVIYKPKIYEKYIINKVENLYKKIKTGGYVKIKRYIKEHNINEYKASGETHKILDKQYEIIKKRIYQI